jgi:subtilase family serine protease
VKKVFTIAAAIAAVMSAAACGGLSSSSVVPAGAPRIEQDFATFAGVPACNDPRPFHANCFALLPPALRANFQPAPSAPFTTATPLIYGYHPKDLQAAYKLDATRGSGRLIAIVDAYGDPNLAADLNYYRKAFGLPSCTISSKCFRIVDQNGGTAYPAANAGWIVEQTLDVDMVSANCPYCHILMVQANSNGFGDLAAAVNEAASLGAIAISNSYGSGEFYDATIAAAYNHPNIAITVSAGDGGYGAATPATFPNVIAIGGTSLVRATNARGFSETVWGGTGSGCSTFIPKPSWQHDVGCTMRMTTDVAYDADPGTGVAFYSSYPNTTQTASGWGIVGGTSIGAPAIAAIFGLRSHTVSDASGIYAKASYLFDVTSGTNSSSACPSNYYCNGEVGYDGPTGNGTPNTSLAF